MIFFERFSTHLTIRDMSYTDEFRAAEPQYINDNTHLMLNRHYMAGLQIYRKLEWLRKFLAIRGGVKWNTNAQSV